MVIVSRPRGYLGVGRDTFLVDGKVPEGVGAGAPANDSGQLRFAAGPPRAIKVQLNGETVTVRTWPAADGHIVIAGFHQQVAEKVTLDRRPHGRGSAGY